MTVIQSMIDNHCAVVTIRRPPLNILDSTAYVELSGVFAELENDPAVRVVVLTGEGRRAFCAGADIKEFAALDEVTGCHYSARNQSVRNRIWDFPKPVIAAVNGLALGGGCVLSMVCDLRIASAEAKFSFGEINMGIIGGTQYAIRMLPACVARHLVYTGEMITADEALHCGLVNRVVAPGAVLEEALHLAGRIAAKSPLALRCAKQSMNSGYTKTLGEGLALEFESLRQLWGSADKREGVAAFVEKRPPVFLGR